MKKSFCDKCGIEVKVATTGQLYSLPWTVNVRVHRQGFTNDCDMCDSCLTDVVSEAAANLRERLP